MKEIINFLLSDKNKFIVSVSCLAIYYISDSINLDFITVGDFSISLQVLRFLMLGLSVVMGIFWIVNVIFIKFLRWFFRVFPMKKVLRDLPEDYITRFKQMVLENNARFPKDLFSKTELLELERKEITRDRQYVNTYVWEIMKKLYP